MDPAILLRHVPFIANVRSVRGCDHGSAAISYRRVSLSPRCS